MVYGPRQSVQMFTDDFHTEIIYMYLTIGNNAKTFQQQ